MPDTYGYIKDFGIKAVYPKLHHGDQANQPTLTALSNGWADRWRRAGFLVVGWGWLEGSPVNVANVAVNLCQQFDLDGYIANGEDGIEGANKWKSAPFVSQFRYRAPRAPLALSHIGDGYPYRDLDFWAWAKAGAGFMPQCYWGTSATSIDPSIWAHDRVGTPHRFIFPTLGTSSFPTPYPAEFYATEVVNLGQAYNVWLLESTTDDYLRQLHASVLAFKQV